MLSQDETQQDRGANVTEFVRNAWYTACWSKDLKTDEFRACRILDERVVLFRDNTGTAKALRDICPHRLVPLSTGFMKDGDIVCGYHGMRFGGDGVCVDIPGQEKIPPRACVQTFPVIERHNQIWIWLGDPDKSDPELVPNVFWVDDPAWQPVMTTLRYECNWMLLVDNLLDLIHVTYIHPNSIGTQDVADTPIKTERKGDSFQVTRWMKNVVPSVLHKELGGFEGNVDRWQIIDFIPPSTVIVEAGSMPAGADDKTKGINTRVVNMMTPVDYRSVIHYCSFTRNFALDDTELDEKLYDSQIDILSDDQGVVYARRIVEDMLAAEQ